ncbi:hypothetical protein K3495_g7796 [Podosphaera aphanis]|nr:hypothetical protein K3495_g7796 [Podosphaera aphanis]
MRLTTYPIRSSTQCKDPEREALMESEFIVASFSDSSAAKVMLNPLEMRETEVIPSLRPGTICIGAGLTAVASALRRGASSVRRKITLGPLELTVGVCTAVRDGRLTVGRAGAEGAEAGELAAVAA